MRDSSPTSSPAEEHSPGVAEYVGVLNKLMARTPRDEAGITFVLAQIARRRLHASLGFKDLAAFALAHGLSKSADETDAWIEVVDEIGVLLDRAVAIRLGVLGAREPAHAGQGQRGADAPVGPAPDRSPGSTAFGSRGQHPGATQAAPSTERSSPRVPHDATSCRAAEGVPGLDEQRGATAPPGGGTVESKAGPSSPANGRGPERGAASPERPRTPGLRVLIGAACSGRGSPFKRTKSVRLDEDGLDIVSRVFDDVRALLGEDLTEGDALLATCELVSPLLRAVREEAARLTGSRPRASGPAQQVTA